MRARAGNETEEGRPGRPRAADFHDEEDEGENGGGGESELEEGSDHDVDEDDGPGPAKRPRIDESQFPWQPWNSSKITPSISRPPGGASPIPQNVQNSPRSNGSLSWQERPSTSTPSTRPTIPLRSMKSRLTRYLKALLSDSQRICPTTQAVLVAFPHRYRELALYQQYMSSLFRTTAIPLHCRVFVLDRAIRNRVGRCRNILLSETDKFRDLERSHISPVGMAYQEFEEGRSESRLKRKNGDRARSLDACRRWNGGVCPSSDGKCRYKHVCSSCKGGHPVSSCPGRA